MKFSLPSVENLGRYIVGIMVLMYTGYIEYSILMGRDLIFGHPVQPSVPPEMVGRILGWFEASTALFLAWLFQSTKSSQASTTALAKVAEKSGGV